MHGENAGLILTAAELLELTGYKQRAAQARWLELMASHTVLRPTGGSLFFANMRPESSTVHMMQPLLLSPTSHG